jgi:hypothetical protein
MSLEELNTRWRETDKVHAEGEGDHRYWVCPACGGQGQTQQALIGAMSDALAHKNHCPALS